MEAERRERYVLAAVATGDVADVRASLAELAELLHTAGGETAGFVIQNLPHPDPATYLGSGKVREMMGLFGEGDIRGVICDDELTPAQMKNLSEMLDVPVIDRTVLILDIFAAHAKTKEGKIQVELAQLQYRSSHLTGLGKSLSRLGGGIGTRGPGETKLETDRREIRRRIASLRQEVNDIVRVRKTTRKKRMESLIPTAAIVGYTNAGKSSLLNCLSDADVLAEDMLFATLDPTTRAVRLERGQEMLMTDTVGFIHKLPHHLVDAFRSTLEEARLSDILIHVVDASNPDAELHLKVVYETLSELGISGKPILTIWNKCDLLEEGEIFRDPRANENVRLSAKTGEGKQQVFDALQRLLEERYVHLSEVIPYAQSSRLAWIRQYGQLLKEEYEPDGIHVEAYVPHI